MALPKKNTRKITINDSPYRWGIYGKKNSKILRVELHERPASQLIATSKSFQPGVSVPFTPAIVASIIEKALALGWQPENKNPAEFLFEGLESLDAVGEAERRKQLLCFAIVPHDHSGARIGDTIARTVRELGMQFWDPPDDRHSPISITENVIKAITTSDLVIADVSRQNPNVYYEVGYAHALRKTTILIVEEDNDIKIPTALSGHLYLTYETSNLQPFKEFLSKTILRSIKQGIL